MKRKRRQLLGLAFATLVALLVLEPEARATPIAERGAAGFGPPGVWVERRLGAQVPLDAAFTDTNAHRESLAAVLGRGRPALLVLAYNRCAMLCNLVLRHVASAVRDAELEPGRDFDLVTISIDPDELPLQAGQAQQTALSRVGFENQPARWPFLVGAQPEIARVAQSVGVHYAWDARTRQYAHPAVVFVLSKTGTVTSYLEGLSWSGAELERALREPAGPASASFASASFLRCFRPDSTNSRYGGAIRRSLQGGAALVLLALVSLVVHARRSRKP